MLKNSFKKLLAGLSFFACASAFAVPFTVDVSGIQSHGELGDVDNTVLLLDVGANSTITGVSYDFNLTAFDPSYLSEMALGFERSDFLDGVFFRPGAADADPGTASYSGFADLIALGLSFQVADDGILRLEFFETYDDFFGSPDGIWNFGTITFEVEPVDEPAPVPEPASALLLAGGLAAMGYSGRRRRAAQKTAPAIH